MCGAVHHTAASVLTIACPTVVCSLLFSAVLAPPYEWIHLEGIFQKNSFLLGLLLISLSVTKRQSNCWISLLDSTISPSVSLLHHNHKNSITASAVVTVVMLRISDFSSACVLVYQLCASLGITVFVFLVFFRCCFWLVLGSLTGFFLFFFFALVVALL